MIDKQPLRQMLKEVGFAVDLPEGVLDQLAATSALVVEWQPGTGSPA